MSEIEDFNMPNRHRGEIEAVFDGKPYTLCLTLGALAELEGAFGATDMVALAARFESGRLKASDAARIIGAGLRGGGHGVTDDEVAAMSCEGGAAGYVGVVVRLLEATFGGGESGALDTADGRRADPFPGTT